MDASIFSFLFSLGSKPWMTWFAVFCAEYLVYVLLIFFIILLFKEKNFKKRIYFFLYVIVAELMTRGIITEGIRYFYHRPRPFVALSLTPLIAHDPTASFPSGHTVFAVTLALLFFFFGKKWGWTALGIAVLIGLGRIMVGVHWPSDVLFGGVIACVVFWILFKFFPFKKEKRQEVIS